MSCASARSVLSSSPAARSRTWLAISASTRKRCATGVRQTEADTGRRRELLTSDEREELKRLRKESRRAAAVERNPEGRLPVFRDGGLEFAAGGVD
jgi:hypothetical protein